MGRKRVADLMGWTSLLCSVAFWVMLAAFLVNGPSKVDMTFGQWTWVWGIAVLLALGAAAMGSRRWALAALLPVFNFLSLVVLLNLQELRH